MTKSDFVVLGRITGAHGIKGWVKLHSDTDPRDAIFDFQPWLLGPQHQVTEVRQGRNQGKLLVAELAGLGDREAAESLTGQVIVVYRDQLPDLPESQYYWDDLIGLEVVNRSGAALGAIREIMATGANDVMVVQGDRERLIPFVMGTYVSRVDLEAGTLEVDWDPEF